MPDGTLSTSHGLPDANTALHRRLCAFNRVRLSPALPDATWQQDIATAAEALHEEGDFLEQSRRAVSDRAADAPTDADGFIEWFEALKQDGPGQGDPLFPWLAEHATLEEMRWFLTQEVAGEAGFDDLAALTQVKMPVRPKLELARNYWDEMGRGAAKGMHGPMLEVLAIRLQLTPSVETTIWQALALANTMAGLAGNRRYAYHSVGALGVVELTAPIRSGYTAAGLKRLGVPSKDRHYFDLHSVLDVKHSEAWNAEVIRPLVADAPHLAHAIAEGALMRLECGAACFVEYRKALGLGLSLDDKEKPASEQDVAAQ